MEGTDENNLAAEVNKIIKDSRPEFVAKSMEQIIELIPPSFDFIGLDLVTENGSYSYQFATGKEVKSFLEEHIPAWIYPISDSIKPTWTAKNLCAGRINQEGYPAKWIKEGISTINARLYHGLPESCHTRINAEEEADGTLVVRLTASEESRPEEILPLVKALKKYDRPEVEDKGDNQVPDIKY